MQIGILNKVAGVIVTLLLVIFVWNAWQVNEQAERVNTQQQQIRQLIDDQSPLIFAFQNTGPTGRLTFVVTCERGEGEPKYNCNTTQTEPVQAQLTPVPTPSVTATPTR